MAETYEAIINEIEQLDSGGNYNRYLLNHGIERLHEWGFTDMALDIAARVREAVGGDPSEWWVEDADGNRVHIGDTVDSPNSGLIAVIGLSGENDGRKIVQYSDGFDYADTVRKVIPDSREKIIEDTLDDLTEHRCLERFTGAERAIIEKAVDRAMKLPEVDA